MIASRFLRLPALLMLGLLASCASTSSRVAVPYDMVLTADEQLNPDATGRPSPIQVLVFELRSGSAFEATDFFALQSDPQGALQGDVLNVEQIVLRPGQTHRLRRPGDLQAGAVGVVAGYRQLDASVWRVLLPLPESRTTNIYKFWQASPDAVQVRLQLRKNAIHVLD
ncbi:type VI secretion system lipoprotein TssJ [Alcaligenes sp. SDU_A2]|uniref:type VI secretion system lipoprotein TssJ n=1 Tax=Alcaligenes sp. SDU_A2 TaxID=3136634 RepID=UPI002B7CA245|nr:type VI secretion system lipoprotein TssJ [Alcaligenes sp.]HRL26091.1 type VI secretion system lipoprotein TssJ [Alcaligenes sp.]